MARTSRNSGQLYGASYANITTLQAGQNVKAGSGILRRVIVGGPVATTVITLWDSLTATGAKIATITIPASPVPAAYNLDIAFNLGLTVQVATAASDITIAFE